MVAVLGRLAGQREYVAVSRPEATACSFTDSSAESRSFPSSKPTLVFGADWQRSPGPVPHDFDSDPSGGLEGEVTPWFISGSPTQLMIRVFEHGVFLARPEGSWASGTYPLVYAPSEQRYVSVHEIETPETETLVRDLLHRRRSGFRYCCYCRCPTPSELRVGDRCMSCATTWEFIVY